MCRMPREGGAYEAILNTWWPPNLGKHIPLPQQPPTDTTFWSLVMPQMEKEGQQELTVESTYLENSGLNLKL